MICSNQMSNAIMFAHHNYQAGIVWVTALCLLQQVACKPGSIRQVVEKVDAYATGVTKSSELSVDDVNGALEEWRGWSEQQKQQARGDPRTRLAIDFVIYPLELAALQFEQTSHEFVERAQDAYKMFRAAYLDGKLFDDGQMIRADRFMKIFDALMGKIPLDQLTTRDFIMAREAYDSWKDKLDEVARHEDIYAMIPTLKMMFNYFNNPFVKTLSEEVFPRLKEDSDVSYLIGLYVHELKAKQNIVINEAGWMKKNPSDVSAQRPDKQPDLDQAFVDLARPALMALM